MAIAPGVIQPPFYDPPIADYPSGQQHSQAWTEYHQSVADRLAATTATIAANKGVTDGSDAASGQVGEYISAMVAAVSPVSLTNATPTNITSVALTAGDWDVRGLVVFRASAGTIATYIADWISAVSATVPPRPNDGAMAELAISFPAGVTQSMPTGTARVSVGAPITVYLSCYTQFSVSTMGAYGFLGARRCR